MVVLSQENVQVWRSIASEPVRARGRVGPSTRHLNLNILVAFQVVSLVFEFNAVFISYILKSWSYLAFAICIFILRFNHSCNRLPFLLKPKKRFVAFRVGRLVQAMQEF